MLRRGHHGRDGLEEPAAEVAVEGHTLAGGPEAVARRPSGAQDPGVVEVGIDIAEVPEGGLFGMGRAPRRDGVHSPAVQGGVEIRRMPTLLGRAAALRLPRLKHGLVVVRSRRGDGRRRLPLAQRARAEPTVRQVLLLHTRTRCETGIGHRGNAVSGGGRRVTLSRSSGRHVQVRAMHALHIASLLPRPRGASVQHLAENVVSSANRLTVCEKLFT